MSGKDEKKESPLSALLGFGGGFADSLFGAGLGTGQASAATATGGHVYTGGVHIGGTAAANNTLLIVGGVVIAALFILGRK